MATTQAFIYNEVYDFLASTPTPEPIIPYRPSPAAQERLSDLLEKDRTETLTDAERLELGEWNKVEHFRRMLKAHARLKLATP